MKMIINPESDKDEAESLVAITRKKTKQEYEGKRENQTLQSLRDYITRGRSSWQSPSIHWWHSHLVHDSRVCFSQGEWLGNAKVIVIVIGCHCLRALVRKELFFLKNRTRLDCSSNEKNKFAFNCRESFFLMAFAESRRLWL